jgi:hypothetical protein
VKCTKCLSDLMGKAPIMISIPGEKDQRLCQSCWHKEMRHHKDEIPEEVFSSSRDALRGKT